MPYLIIAMFLCSVFIAGAINPAYTGSIMSALVILAAKAFFILCFAAAAQIIVFPGALAQAHMPAAVIISANLMGITGLAFSVLFAISYAKNIIKWAIKNL